MLGLDFMRYTPCRVQNGDTSDAVEKAIEFSRAGGIVTFCWHWNVPDKYLLSGTDGGNPRWWGGFYTKNVDRSKFSLTKIMNGSDPKGYNTLMSDVDEIAKQLKRLSDADVRYCSDRSTRQAGVGSGGVQTARKPTKSFGRQYMTSSRMNTSLTISYGYGMVRRQIGIPATNMLT